MSVDLETLKRDYRWQIENGAPCVVPKSQFSAIIAALERAERVEAAAVALLEESELIFLSCNDPDDEDTPWPETIVNLRLHLR